MTRVLVRVLRDTEIQTYMYKLRLALRSWPGDEGAVQSWDLQSAGWWRPGEPWCGAGLAASRLKTQEETIFQFKSKGRGEPIYQLRGRQEFSGALGPAHASAHSPSLLLLS